MLVFTNAKIEGSVPGEICQPSTTREPGIVRESRPATLNRQIRKHLARWYWNGECPTAGGLRTWLDPHKRTGRLEPNW